MNNPLIDFDTEVQKNQKVTDYQDQFTAIVQENRDSLINTAYGFLHNKESAMDVVQDALLKAYSKLHTFKNQSNLYTWIYRITVNLCKDRLRQNKRKKEIGVEDMGAESRQFELPDLELNPRSQAEHNEKNDLLNSIIDSLPDNHKKVLILREAGGLSYKEIAEVLQCREGTVMSRLFHARKILANRLQPFLEELNG